MSNEQLRNIPRSYLYNSLEETNMKELLQELCEKVEEVDSSTYKVVYKGKELTLGLSLTPRGKHFVYVKGLKGQGTRCTLEGVGNPKRSLKYILDNAVKKSQRPPLRR